MVATDLQLRSLNSLHRSLDVRRKPCYHVIPKDRGQLMPAPWASRLHEAIALSAASHAGTRW